MQWIFKIKLPSLDETGNSLKVIIVLQYASTDTAEGG